MEKYKVVIAKVQLSNNIEGLINEQYKEGWVFVCFVPWVNGMFGKQRILFKRK